MSMLASLGFWYAYWKERLQTKRLIKHDYVGMMQIHFRAAIGHFSTVMPGCHISIYASDWHVSGNEFWSAATFGLCGNVVAAKRMQDRSCLAWSHVFWGFSLCLKRPLQQACHSSALGTQYWLILTSWSGLCLLQQGLYITLFDIQYNGNYPMAQLL